MRGKYPIFNKDQISEINETGEYLLSKLIDDANEILKVIKIKPSKMSIYISSKWKNDIYRKAINLFSKNKLEVGLLMKEIMSDTKMKPIAKQVSQFVGKLPSEIKKLNENDRKRYTINFDSAKYLIDANEYLNKVFSCKVSIYREGNKEIYDPANKARFAVPLRPAIYIEWNQIYIGIILSGSLFISEGISPILNPYEVDSQ